MKPPFNVPIDQVTPESFEEMCQAHDLMYHYSDDHSVWRSGEEEEHIILRASDKLGKDIATPIWNKVVLTKISLYHAKQFLWEE